MTHIADRKIMAKALADRLNILPIAVFCLWLAAFAYFWAKISGPLRSFDMPIPALGGLPWFVASILVGLAVLALPDSYYRLRPIELSGRIYERLGVKAFRAFVTNGDLINRIVTRRYGDYRVHRHGHRVAAAEKTSLQSERSHLVCFVAGAVACIYAAAIGWWGWMVWMTITNILGNLYPVLVQRHTRARLAKLTTRKAGLA